MEEAHGARFRISSLILLSLAAVICWMMMPASSQSAQVSATWISSGEVFTDTSDYAPFDTVWINGSGFWANETVTVQVTHHDGYPEGGEGHDPWDVVADDYGAFLTHWVVPPDDQVDETLLVTCTGVESGLVATSLFTDANTKLTFTTTFSDTICGGTVEVCANLRENCGGGTWAPLEGRDILFFINTGDCGNDVSQVADDSVLTDENGNACATLTLPTTPGTYSIRVKFRGEDKPEWWEPANSACDENRRTKLSAGNECETFEIDPNYGTAPMVDLGSDTTLNLCLTQEICLPVDIIDGECDVDSVVASFGDYLGTMANYDQVSWINSLGGTVTQSGGGAPGTILYDASDFVPPVNTQSGVSVTLPNFIFGATVDNPGSFPTGLTPGNSATHLLGSPTDLTFTTPGPGGPDGGDGDGSIDFAPGNTVTIGFAQDVKTCNGSNSDFIVFTNSGGNGMAELKFLKDGSVVHSLTHSLPGQTAGSGIGALNLDLPDGILFDAIQLSCLSGNLEVDAVAARIAASPSTQDLCFTPDTSGVYTIEVTAWDKCGHMGSDVVFVTVNLNTAPVVDAGADQNIQACTPSEICLPISITDADNNISSRQKLNGPGTFDGSQICFTPTGSGVYQFVVLAVDSCGLSDRDTVVVTVDLNGAPVATDPDTVTMFLCVPMEQCYQFVATDPENDDLTWVGSVDPLGEFCFTPTTSGTYGVTVAVTDPCGAADTVSIIYDMTINSAPIATEPASPVTVFQCDPAQICYQFVGTDPNGGTLVWSKLSGDGTVSTSGQWCFTPSGSGTYSVVVVVADSCGRKDTTDLAYDVTVNDPPTITLGDDSTVLLCASDEVCIDYSVSDPQGLAKLVESMEAGYGTIDTAANQICFNPTTSGDYEFIVSVNDSCGELAADTQVVSVTVGNYASITCPEGPIDVSLCAAENVCYMLGITPSGASVTTSFGTYSGGELCFMADTSGTYEIEVIADAACGADTCQLTFNVDIGSAAQITCPAPQDLFICSAQSVCVPIGVVGGGATITVSPIGSYSAGNVCFMADTSGHYELEVIAATDCGSDTCTVIADITINSAPVAVDPPSPVDTFLCDPGQVCYQFAATDVDGGTLTFSKISGNGTVSASGQWCFNVASAGSFTVTAKVTDACGAADTLSMTVNAAINHSPVVNASDATLFMCTFGQTCIPITLTDADNNLDSWALECGTGTIDVPGQKLCFVPDTAGVYTFCLVAYDECGDVDRDTVHVTVDVNDAPIVDLGPDTTVFGCDLGEVCIPVNVNDPDGNMTSAALTSPVGSFDGSQICFTPTGNGSVQFIISAVDDCGSDSYDTLNVTFQLNTPPVADAGPDDTLALCGSTQICWPAGCSDVDDNLASCQLISGPGTYDGSQICFTPTVAGSYQFVLEATDDCGEVDRDTVTIDVAINQAPVCNVPNDTSIFLCASEEVCLPVYATDADENVVNCNIISGPGSLVNGVWCYTPVGHQVVTVTVQCVDACGLTCQESFTVEFNVNAAPLIVFGNDTTMNLCDTQQVCIPYSADDPDLPNPVTITQTSGPGTLDTANSRICFNATTNATYTFIARIEDGCSLYDEDTINVTINLNAPPVADAGPDQTEFICNPGESICWPAGCTDPNGNLTGCSFSGPGTYDGYDICFTPTANGTYEFIMTATDACGEVDVDTSYVTVTINEAPTLALPADSSVTLCSVQPVCFDYTVNDVNPLSVVTESMISGFGSIDTLANQVCFTPTTDGTYEFILSAVDDCGAETLDTMVIDVTFGEQVAIDCPIDPVPVSLCAAEEVCYAVAIEPSSATITTSLGTYASGEICFMADTTGTYIAEIIASDVCGTDTCQITFNVDVGSSAQLTCPNPQTREICNPGQVCIPVTAMGASVSVSVSPIGSYSNGQVCFPADTSGHYLLEVIAASACGNDTCQIDVTVEINEGPVAVDPTTPIDTFICAPAQICYQFSATDPEGTPLNWSRISGDGTVSNSGEWCFNAGADGQYCVTARVFDNCGAADTVTLCYNVDINSKPVVVISSPRAIFLCSESEVCFNYSATDADNNLVTEELIAGVGTLDTVGNQVCFTPDTSGTYRFIIEATDACGAVGLDTLDVAIDVNHAPVVNAGSDATLFRCNTDPVCLPVSCTDQDNNIDSCYVVGGLADYNGNQICFTPDTSGTYRFILAAVDECGEMDQDTVFVTLTINTGPVCVMPNDTVIAQCASAQIQLPVSATDVDNNLASCEIVSGPGSLSGGVWSFTPTTDAAFYVKILCIDECGEVCEDSFKVDIDINSAPVADAGPDIASFLCQSGQQVCVDYSFTDTENNIVDTAILSPAGASFSNGQICFNPLSTGTYDVIIRAFDACGATDVDTARVTVNINHKPILDLPVDPVVFMENPGQVCIGFNTVDVDNNLTGVSVVELPGNPAVGSPAVNGSQLCFTADVSGVYCFELTATDGCGATDVDTMCVEVEIDECMHVRIEKTHGSLQGQHEFVDILLESTGKQLGGFDFLISYDYSALTVNTVLPGDLITQCGWEYFVFRNGAEGNCSGGCPSGVLRIVAIAETNNGANHPGCLLESTSGSLATIDFIVSNDRTLECQYAPVQFFWADCGDNSFSGPTGDTLWISRDVFSFELVNIADNSYGFPGYFGAPDYCLLPEEAGKPHPLRCVDFTNGGVDIVCADSIDARGDINLNGIAYEVADAVMYSNYFVSGLGVFQINQAGQIAASDVNADGLTLSVADLVYMIRVIAGDAVPYIKLVPGQEPKVSLNVIDGVLAVSETEAPIGALYLTLEGRAVPKLHESAANMQLKYNFDGANTRVLIYDLSGENRIDVGDVLDLNGNNAIVSAEVGTWDGRPMAAKVTSLPSRFELSQNYPNPFNPVTTIEFALPVATKWDLTIYNVLGQVVQRFSEEGEAGYHKIEWDAGRYASGVYLYRLTAGDFSQTRKMVLLK